MIMVRFEIVWPDVQHCKILKVLFYGAVRSLRRRFVKVIQVVMEVGVCIGVFSWDVLSWIFGSFK